MATLIRIGLLVYYIYLSVFVCFLQEMMYVWNGFLIVGKRTDLIESLLVTVEKEENNLKNETSKWNFLKLTLYALSVLWNN